MFSYDFCGLYRGMELKLDTETAEPYPLEYKSRKARYFLSEIFAKKKLNTFFCKNSTRKGL